jgi:hypothetical protein
MWSVEGLTWDFPVIRFQCIRLFSFFNEKACHKYASEQTYTNSCFLPVFRQTTVLKQIVFFEFRPKFITLPLLTFNLSKIENVHLEAFIYVSCKKVKLSLCLAKHHAMKTYGEWRYSSTHFDLGTRWRWAVSITLRPLCPQGKNPWYPMDRRLGGHQSRSGHNG